MTRKKVILKFGRKLGGAAKKTAILTEKSLEAINRGQERFDNALTARETRVGQRTAAKTIRVQRQVRLAQAELQLQELRRRKRSLSVGTGLF